MNGYKFYLEYPNKKEKNAATRKNVGNHCGTVISVIHEQKWLDTKNVEWMYSAAHAVQDIPNNPVCFCSCSDGYLREKCKRISEKQAREIHPNLFKVLDSQN